MNEEALDNSKSSEELDKKRKRSDVSSLSDIGENSFNIDAKQSEDESIKLKYQSVKPKDKKKKKLQKMEQPETEIDIQSIEKKFTENQRTIQAVYEQIKNINTKMDNMICKDELESTFKKMFDSKVNDIVSKVKEEVYRSVSHRIDVVEGELHTTKVEMDTLRNNITTMKESINTKDETITKLEKELEKSKQSSTEQIDELEQYTRKNSVRLNGPGLPIEKDGEKETAEQTTKLAIKILKENMGMELEERDIDIAHRIGVKRRQVPRPMIVKFVSRNDKIKSLKDKKTKLRGTGIYIQEDLTHLKAKVLKEARESRETESAWSRDGHIYIKLQANGTIEQIKPADYDDWLSR